ncbi:hypothetical protein RQP46_005289 [Phenoliferia psychrophenolica]
MSDESGPTNSKESDLRDTLDSPPAGAPSRLPLQVIQRAEGCLEGGTGVHKSQKRSNVAAPESGGDVNIGTKATRTEQYLHLQLQLAHFERLRSIEEISDAAFEILLSASDGLQELQGGSRKRWDEVERTTAECRVHQDLLVQTQGILDNVRQQHVIWGRIKYSYLLFKVKICKKRYEKAHRQRAKAFDAKSRDFDRLAAAGRAHAINLPRIYAAYDITLELILQLVILSKGP